MKTYFLIVILFLIGISSQACTPQAIPSTPPAAEGTFLSTAQNFLLRGDQYASLKNYDQAIAQYTQAIQLKPDYAEASNDHGLAYALKSKSQMVPAITDYSQAIQWRPTYANAYNNRGVAFMASGHPEEALNDFNHATQLQPGFPQANRNRGNYYWRAGRYALAFLDLFQANFILIESLVLLSLLLGVIFFAVFRRRHAVRLLQSRPLSKPK